MGDDGCRKGPERSVIKFPSGGRVREGFRGF